MIRFVEIKNFKSLNHLVLSDLGRINLFGGKNNVGKTTLLEALFLFFDRLNPNMLLRQYNWRGVAGMPIRPDTMFAPIFCNFDLSKIIQIKIVRGRGAEEIMSLRFKDENQHVFSVPVRIDERLGSSNESIQSLVEIEYKDAKRKEEDLFHFFINTNGGFGMQVVQAKFKEEQHAYFLGSKIPFNPVETAVRYGELDIRGEAEQLLPYLQTIEPRLRSLVSIALPNGESMLYGDIGLVKKVPIAYMGDGLSRLLTILLAISYTRNGVVFIDEIENGFHYSTMPKIWDILMKAANDYDCQIFATTHSYECLSSAVTGISEKKDDFRYIRLERTKEKIVPKTFSFSMIQMAVEQGWEVR
ncbi:ATP/GTP-binding protein [Anoxybacillus sp.]|uniref:AAA family ATPase n=1 Tax=Anoxybacillus sp. TaxID=1872573 RepID=UPI00262EC5FD|nr:ATP/GTP-binding protein [uncultured Anoxybacillus sp.]